MIKPNIVLISIDTLRADHLSCYGYGRQVSPFIDSLAAQGTIYRNNYSTGVWTPPGHASMLTGLYVSEHGVYGDRRLSHNIPTIATVLRANGYQTAGFVNNSQVGELVGLDKGHDTFVEVWKGIKPRSTIERVVRGGIRKIRESLGHEDMGASRTNKLIRDWIGNHIDRETPFYAFLHYIEPHNPLNPPHPYKNKYLDKSFTNLDMKKMRKVAHNPLICFVEDLNLSQEEIEFLKALYDAEIAYTDSKISEIVTILKENNLYENTMIIITADHGEHFGEHGLFSHVASLYEEILRVPLIIKFPLGVSHPKEVTHLTQLVDIFPTVMDITHLPKESLPNNSGISLLDKLETPSNCRNFIFAEWEGRIPMFLQDYIAKGARATNIDPLKVKMRVLRDQQYKYIWREDGKEELYHITSDHKELNNLANTKPNITRTYRDKLLELADNFPHSPLDAKTVQFDDDVKKNLEALGYM
jgi:arylsulfatase A-like enzyme